MTKPGMSYFSLYPFPVSTRKRTCLEKTRQVLCYCKFLIKKRCALQNYSAIFFSLAYFSSAYFSALAKSFSARSGKERVRLL